MWDVTNILSCRHNVLIVFHEIAGSNKQTPLTEPNKQPPHQGQGSALIPFVTIRTQPYLHGWVYGWVWVVTNGIRANPRPQCRGLFASVRLGIWLGTGRYKWYQSWSPTPVWGFVWLRKGCLFVWPRDPMGHNENVMSAWGGVCDVPHRIGRKFLTLYM